MQVLACHGSLVRGNGTREDGVAIARLSHMHTDWKSLWSTTAATHQWLSDADIARNRQDRYANYYEHTPQACKPYAHDLFYGARNRTRKPTTCARHCMTAWPSITSSRCAPSRAWSIPTARLA